MTPHRYSTNEDEGFTLIESLVSIVLMGLVTSVVAAAIVVIFRTDDSVVSLTAESQDTRQVVNYLVSDVQSGPSHADSYRATVGGQVGDHGSGCNDIGNENILRIEITDRRADVVEKRIAYRLVQQGAEARIDRYVCVISGGLWVPDGPVLNIADALNTSVVPIAEARLFVDNGTLAVANQLVQRVELRYAQQGATEVVAAAPREEDPSSSSGLCQSDPLRAVQNIDTFIEGDVTLHNTTVKSTLYVGGKLTFDGSPSVAQSNPQPTNLPAPFTNLGLLVGGVNWGASTGTLSVQNAMNGIIHDGVYTVASGQYRPPTGSTSSARITFQGSGAPINPPPATKVIAPGDAFFELRACSDRLAGLPSSCNDGACASHVGLPTGYLGTANPTSNQLRLTMVAGKTNAFNIDAANLVNLGSGSGIQLQFDGPGSPGQTTPLIINVRSAPNAVIDFAAPDLQANGNTPVYVIWNFPNAGQVIIRTGNGELRGTVLAPYSTVTSYANIGGGVAARHFEMFGSSLNSTWSFDGRLAW